MLVLESLVGLHRTIQLQLLCVWSINLYYCDTEWLSLEMNRDLSVIFDTAPKYCILDSLVDYEGYSISSKEFLSTVVKLSLSELNSRIPICFSSLIPKISTLGLMKHYYEQS